jgi:hypothetical protein
MNKDTDPANFLNLNILPKMKKYLYFIFTITAIILLCSCNYNYPDRRFEISYINGDIDTVSFSGYIGHPYIKDGNFFVCLSCSIPERSFVRSFKELK